MYHNLSWVVNPYAIFWRGLRNIAVVLGQIAALHFKITN